MSGKHRRVKVQVDVGDARIECHLQPGDEGGVFDDVVSRRPIPSAISPMTSPDSERNTAPIPAGPVASPVLWRAAPSVYRVALTHSESRRLPVAAPLSVSRMP